MINLLPQYYRKSEIIPIIYKIVQKMLDKLNADINILDKNLFVITADKLESFLKNTGLTDDKTTDTETLRAMILSRLRGGEILTKAGLSELINLYEVNDFEIVEEPDKITVNFLNQKGMPRNFKQLRQAIDDFKPAHVEIEYNTQYVTWGEVKQNIKTWGAVKAYTWGELSKLNTNISTVQEE